MPEGLKTPVKNSITIHTGLILKYLMAPSLWDRSYFATEPIGFFDISIG